MKIGYTFYPCNKKLEKKDDDPIRVCIFLHGLGSSKKSFKQPTQMARLTPVFHVLIPDLIGSGESVCPLTAESYTMENQAQAIWSLVQWLFPNPLRLLSFEFAVVGASLGFLVALQMAQTNSEVKWLVSLDGTLQLSARATSRQVVKENKSETNSREFALYHTCKDAIEKVDTKWPQSILLTLTKDEEEGKILFLMPPHTKVPSWLPLSNVVHVPKSKHSLHMDNPKVLYCILEKFLMRTC